MSVAPRPRALPPALLAALFLACYILLDWASFVHPWAPVGITPWNPPPGLSLALLLIKGLRWSPLLMVAALAADVIVRDLPAPWLPTVMSAGAIAVGYTMAAAILRRRIRSPHAFGRVGDMMTLMAVAAPTAFVVGLAYVGAFTWAGAIPAQQYWGAVARFWIGDMIGVVVLTPLVLVLAGAGSWQWRRLEVAAQTATLVLALWVIFGFEATDEFRFFYLLFVPVVWMAVRHGFTGAAVAVALTQVGLMVALDLTGHPAAQVTALQFLMLAVAATGLLLGAAVGEHRRVQAALRESRARLAAILETAGDGILTVDDAGRIASSNPAAARLFTADPTGLPLVSLLPSLALDDGTGEVSGTRTDGAMFPAEVAVSHAEIGGENVHVVIVRDISARKEAEAKLHEQQSRLAHVARLSAAGEMASALAHELNQPLAAIMNYTRGCLRLLAATPPDQARIAEAIAKAADQAGRAGEIIRRLREFIRKGEGSYAPVQVEAIVDEVSGLAAAEAHQHGVCIHIQARPDLPAVLADRIQIQQVLMNLVRNGIEAAAAAGGVREVVVAVGTNAVGMIEFAVSDSGAGIDPTVLPRLFTPFASVKPAGMGLGLAISRSIVEGHGGRLWLTKDERGRTTFRFTVRTIAEKEA